MPSGRQGSLRLFRFAGVDVFLHWTWFLVAVFEIQGRAKSYSSLTWNVLEYLALFLIVLLHEYGHALACRSVGGVADQIVLWPLGGVAYVNPPQRAGATLWSIAAGPLVNFVLAPVLWVLARMSRVLDAPPAISDPHALLRAVFFINLGLLIFNLLPIYPLDGGQILRSLLWFVLGRAHSLMAAAVLGVLGAVAFLVFAVQSGSGWLGLLAVFILLNCWTGMKAARALSRLARLPRRQEFSCPSCGSAPPIGTFWRCSKCGTEFDTFVTQAVCPQCAAQFPVTMCLDCGRPNPMQQWVAGSAAASTAGTIG